MFSTRAAWIAARRRGLYSGSGKPIFAATVISLASLAKSLERFLSCAPLLYMMFLNCEWPAIPPPKAFRIALEICAFIEGAPSKIHSARHTTEYTHNVFLTFLCSFNVHLTFAGQTSPVAGRGGLPSFP